MKSRNGYNEAVVRAFMREYGVPEPEFEFQFAPPRKWRWDISWIIRDFGNRDIITSKLGLECQGGLWSGGAHVRPQWIIREHEKRNRAAALGWRIIYCEPKTLCTKATVDLIRECLELPHVPDKHIGMAARV